MRAKQSTIVFAAATLGTLCGCAPLERLTTLSDRARHASFARSEAHFSADLAATSHQAYCVYSGDWRSETPSVDPQSGVIILPATTDKKSPSRGLAIALESDGYLLTAAHVLGATNVVFGEFAGRRDVRPARVVFRSDTGYSDVALIKVESKLDRCAAYGDTPKPGDQAYAIVAYRGKKRADVVLDFAAGTVLKVKEDPSGSPVLLIGTDVPLWRGDSGGPLFSSSGRFIGVNTGCKFDSYWYGVYWKYQGSSHSQSNALLKV
jgi:S1-C subfamily serine protease